MKKLSEIRKNIGQGVVCIRYEIDVIGEGTHIVWMDGVCDISTLNWLGEDKIIDIFADPANHCNGWVNYSATKIVVTTAQS